ncbi:MAG TPA: carboxynorspermidine decarboxylase [Candidatus Caccomonas pullistercoris]|nr:carboxynorspermidine decarboxylase [Candidatus Caccomonas pullistercoris]
MDNTSLHGLATPYYVLDEAKLRANLRLIQSVARQSGAEIILAFKAYALWRTFSIFREYIGHTTASSPYEARLAYEEFGSKAHTYSPAYEKQTFHTILECSSHVTFNSLSQYAHFIGDVKTWNAHHAPVSCGLRINPEYSEIETELYNPCAPGSRFGVLASQLPDNLPEGIEGFHCHNHCESSTEALARSLEHVEEKFGRWLDKIKWLNLGGGHLMTREGYDIGLLIHTLVRFGQRHPNLHLILEPGSAFAWRTGDLVCQVVDVVENDGIKTAILNVSFTCHMPDCLEMPYWPTVTGATTLSGDDAVGHEREATVYRLGGNSCLSGDFMGYWQFPAPLRIGDTVTFEDMIHYTTVKTTMFNGIGHPAIVLLHENGQAEVLRRYAYEDYRDRMC